MAYRRAPTCLEDSYLSGCVASVANSKPFGSTLFIALFLPCSSPRALIVFYLGVTWLVLGKWRGFLGTGRSRGDQITASQTGGLDNAVWGLVDCCSTGEASAPLSTVSAAVLLLRKSLLCSLCPLRLRTLLCSRCKVSQWGMIVGRGDQTPLQEEQVSFIKNKPPAQGLFIYLCHLRPPPAPAQALQRKYSQGG